MILFNNKGNKFIFEVTLEVGKIIISIRRKINQNDIDYNEKIDDLIFPLKKIMKMIKLIYYTKIL